MHFYYELENIIAISSVNWVFQNRGISSKTAVIKPCLTQETKSLASKVLPEEQNTEEQNTLPREKV